MRRFLAAFALVLGFASPALANSPFIDCGTPEFASIVGGGADFKCATIRTLDATMAGGVIAIRTVRDASDERSLAYEAIVAEAAQTSFAKFGEVFGGLGYGPVTIMFEPPSPENANGYYALSGLLKPASSAECLLLVNTNRHDSDKYAQKGSDVLLELQNTIAHELFHCVQNWNWPNKMPRVAGKDAKWWVEGTAELAGHLVFESPPTIAARAKDFADQSKAIPLTGMEYANLVFFLWLYQTDPNSIVTFIQKMPESPGMDQQQSALLAAVGDTKLGQFVRDYADGKVHAPSGTPITPPASVPEQEITASGPATFKPIPFGVFVQDVSFKKGQYMIQGKGDADIMARLQGDAAADWTSTSYIATEGPCSKPKVYRLAGMAFGTGASGGVSATEDFTLDVNKVSSCEECAAYAEREQCVTGQWKIENESLRQAVAAYLGETVDAVEVSGFGGMNARADGTHSFVFASFKVDGKPADTPAAVAFRIALAGSIDSKWGAVNGNMRLCYVTSDAKMQTAVPGGFSDPISFADMVSATGNDSQNYDYECSGNDLTLKLKVDGDKTVDIRLKRIGQ